MGWGERANPNSEWNKKRNYIIAKKVEIPIGATPKGEAVEATVMQPKHRLSLFRRLIRFFKGGK